MIHKDPLHGAIMEISSAISALNMWPEPCEPDSDLDADSHERGYLSQTDRWARHAVEHLRAAIDNLEKVKR